MEADKGREDMTKKRRVSGVAWTTREDGRYALQAHASFVLPIRREIDISDHVNVRGISASVSDNMGK